MFNAHFFASHYYPPRFYEKGALAPAPPPAPPPAIGGPPVPPPVPLTVAGLVNQNQNVHLPTSISSTLPSSKAMPSLPSRISLANTLLATMGGLSGKISNYNNGSLFGAFALSQGTELERQGIIASANVTQNIAFSLMNVFDISAAAAIPAQGVVTFSTSVAAGFSVAISQGTILQSAQGIRFITTQAGVLVAGQTSVDVPIQAVIGGPSGNVAVGQITQMISSLSLPLLVINKNPVGGGIEQQSISVALADLAAKVASLNLNSPVSIANAVIGVKAKTSTETVQLSTLVEPWVAQIAASGAIRDFVPTPGFQVFIDNGSGTASDDLISAVKTVIDGDQITGKTGYRPSGVPYSVHPTDQVLASLVVSGTVENVGNATIASGFVQTAISNYFTNLQFGQPAFASELSAQLVNAALGLINSLTVYLYYNNNLNTPVSIVTGAVSSRIIMASEYPQIAIVGS